VYAGSEYLHDPHFESRDFVYSVPSVGGDEVRLLGTPINVAGEIFAATPAPRVGEDTEDVLRHVLGLADDEIAFLVSQVPAGAVRS
jgi:crotonobetainyl-CoA:carnitine CoA-transferase CaiB-like acyl-CoA transferase